MAEITPQELEKLYADRFRQRERGRERIWQVLAGEFFQKWIPQSAVVLDLGAGYGEFLRNIKQNYDLKSAYYLQN